MKRLPTALENGMWLAGLAKGTNHNPYTAVHTVVQYLAGVAKPTDNS